MTLSELEEKLHEAKPGQAVHVSYDVFEIVFFPGIEDDPAKARAYKFAQDNGCSIDHRASSREVIFVKAS